MNANQVLAGAGLLAATFLTDIAFAQDVGDVPRGHEIARAICSECHAVEARQAQSPNLAAPPFEAIANIPGMTAIALSAALHTSHETMPNIVLPRDDARDIIGYILSLREPD